VHGIIQSMEIPCGRGQTLQLRLVLTACGGE
jgi:hypothetical protein